MYHLNWCNVLLGSGTNLATKRWKPFQNDEKWFLFHDKSSFFVLEIFAFLCWLFGYIEKRFDKKVNVTDWTEGKIKWVTPYFEYIYITCNQNKLYSISDCRYRKKYNYYFSWKGLGLVSTPHFVYNFSRKTFLMF